MEPTFLYDGDCGFCSASARFITRRIPTPAAVVPWQWSDLTALGVTRRQCTEAVQWIGPDGAVLAGPAAIAALLRTSNPFWRWAGWLLALPAVTAFAWPVYRWISRHRHQLPGATAACALPPQ